MEMMKFEGHYIPMRSNMPSTAIYPDDIEAKSVRGYFSDTNVLINVDGSISFEVMLFERCFHNMQVELNELFGIKTFDHMLADDRLYEDCFGGYVSFVNFEGTIPKEFQHEALFRLIRSPDAFAEWVDCHNGLNGNPDWQI